MRKTLVIPATFKPLEVDLIMARPEIRGLAGDGDKLTIADFLESAVEAYQDFTANVLCRSAWNLFLDRFPHHREDIFTPAPLVELTNESPPAAATSIAYLDSGGVSKVLAPANYKLDVSSRIVGRISLTSGSRWPSTCHEVNAVTVQFIAGYDDAASIPQRVKDGLIAYVQEMLSGIDMSGAYEAKWLPFKRMSV